MVVIISIHKNQMNKIESFVMIHMNIHLIYEMIIIDIIIVHQLVIY